MHDEKARGAVVVEFALVTLLLILLLMGVVEFGRAWYTVHMLSSAAREGARVGAMLGGGDDREAAIRARIAEVLTPTGVDEVTVNIQLSGGYGQPLRVEIERDFHTVAARLLPGLDELRLRGSAVFNQESP
jgi:Flp pilus assembly protein TadG